MRGIKIPQQDFALKMQVGGGGGGAYAQGGAYLWDTTVIFFPVFVSYQQKIRCIFQVQERTIATHNYF